MQKIFFFILVMMTLGTTAAFITCSFFCLYSAIKNEELEYKKNLLESDTLVLSGDFQNDFRYIYYRFFPFSIKIFYFLKIIPLMALYIGCILFLCAINEDLFWKFSQSNKNLISALSVIIPTIDIHYQSLSDVSVIRAEKLRQIYAVIYSAGLTFFLAFIPLIATISELGCVSLQRAKNSYDKYARIILGLLLILCIIGPLLNILLCAQAVGGSADFLFGKFGAYDVRTNNHFFLYLCVSLLMPLILAYTFLLGIIQYKFLKRRS